MIDFMKEFEAWLPEWSEKKMQPIPTRDHPDRWSEAWSDFMKEYLPTKRKEIINDYKSMKFKTHGDVIKEQEKAEEIIEEPIVENTEPIQEEKPLTEWERVQSMLNRKN